MGKEEIKNKINETVKASKFKDQIKKILLFGSYLQGKEKKNSDIDLLIDFNQSARIGFFDLFDIEKELEKSLKKQVDLVTPNSLSKYFRKEVLNSAEVVYEK